jgi:hypothetical protein
MVGFIGVQGFATPSFLAGCGVYYPYTFLLPYSE